MSICIFCGLPALVYIDDAVYFTVGREQAAVAKAFYHQLAETLGLLMSEKPSADQCSTRNDAVKSLGLQYDWERDSSGSPIAITVSVPEEKEAAAEALEKIVAGADRNSSEKLTLHDMNDIGELVNDIGI